MKLPVFKLASLIATTRQQAFRSALLSADNCAEDDERVQIIFKRVLALFT